MATNTFVTSSTWIPTNALQADTTSPITLPTYSDASATQVLQAELSLPAGSATTLTLPPGWTTVVQARIVNTDPLNYLNLQFGASAATSVTVILAPNGGEFNFTQALVSSATVPLLASQVAFTAYGTWKAQAVSSAGEAATSASSAFIWLSGI